MGVPRPPLQAQEGYDQPEEARNEVGEAVEPFHLRRELEVGGPGASPVAELAATSCGGLGGRAAGALGVARF